jgi:flavin-dependent dehydrogenase
VDKNYTYHVDRSKFDVMLLCRAEELSATVCEVRRVLLVKFTENGRPYIAKIVSDKQSFETTAPLIVHASGRRTLLGHQIKLKVTDPVFDQYAIHTWFEGFDRVALTGEKKDSVVEQNPDHLGTNSWVI